jgi:magnesium-transporting ATPase (P-type)
MKIKELYNYFFYAIYSFWEEISIPKFWSDAKAIFSMITLEAITALSALVYYRFFFNRHSDLLKQKWVYILIFVLTVSFNYYSFIFKDQSKQIVSKYDKWTKEKIDKGNLWVWIIILITLANFIFACCLYSKTIHSAS